MDETTVRRGLSAAWLKYFACVFMLIDHLAYIWNPFYALAGNAQPTPLWANAMFYLGRLAFPIFVFFVAEGCRKTHDIRRYLLRLAVFAAVAQLPFALLFQKLGGSIMFTFLLGVLGVYCLQRLQGRFPKAVALLPALGLAVLGQLTGTDYGLIGVLLVPALYLCGETRSRQLVCLAVGLFASYLIHAPLRYLLTYWVTPEYSLFQVLPAYLAQHLAYHLVVFASSCLSLIPLAFYSGERGRGGKWFFYWFYPAHLLALWGLGMLLR